MTDQFFHGALMGIALSFFVQMTLIALMGERR